MKTLADFKRALTLGSKWHAQHTKYGDLGIRPVSKINTHQVAFKTVRSDGTECDSYMDFPRSHLMKFRDDGTVEIWVDANDQWGEPARCILTYKKIED